MLERVFGFLAATEMRRLARSPGFLWGRGGLAFVAVLLIFVDSANPRPNPEAIVAGVVALALLATLAAGPLLMVLGFERLRATGMLELLLAAGVGRAALVSGVWSGRTWSLLLLNGGGVGALAALFVHGGLDSGMLVRAAVCLGVTAVSTTALALPAAALCRRRGSTWWLAYLPPLLLHFAPNLLGSLLSAAGDALAGLGVVGHPSDNPLTQALLPAVGFVVAHGAWTILPEILGPAATNPVAALKPFLLFHLSVAWACFLWTAWRIGRERRGSANASHRAARSVGDEEPVEWLVRSFPRWSLFDSAGWALAIGCVVGVALLMFPNRPAAGFVAAVWIGEFALLAGVCLRTAMALAHEAPLPRLLEGLPLEPKELVALFERRCRRWPGRAALAGALAIAGLAAAEHAGWFGVVAGFWTVSCFGAFAWFAPAMAVNAGVRSETRLGAAGHAISHGVFAMAMPGQFVLLSSTLLWGAVSAWPDQSVTPIVAMDLLAILGVLGLFVWIVRSAAEDRLRARMYPTAQGPTGTAREHAG